MIDPLFAHDHRTREIYLFLYVYIQVTTVLTIAEGIDGVHCQEPHIPYDTNRAARGRDID
jgi:hypothetical protein